MAAAIRRCEVRVWSNGDAEPCGGELRSRETICGMHRRARLKALAGEIRAAANRLRNLQTERGKLEAEKADPGGRATEVGGG